MISTTHGAGRSLIHFSAPVYPVLPEVMPGLITPNAPKSQNGIYLPLRIHTQSFPLRHPGPLVCSLVAAKPTYQLSTNPFTLWLRLNYAPTPQLLATEKVMLSADCFQGSENNFVPVEGSALPTATEVSA